MLTWPLVLNLTHSYPSTLVMEGGDPNMYIWFMDLMAKKVVDPNLNLAEMVYYPAGMNFLAGYEGPILLTLSTPIVLLTHNPILAYNLVLLTAFILTAYACYIFVLYLTKSYYSAIITGFSFGFSQYMMVRSTQHIDLLFLFTLPFMALYSFKFFENPSKRNILLLSLSVFITALSAWYYLVGGLIFIFILFLFNYRKFFVSKKQYVFAGLGTGLAILLPALPMFLNRSDAAYKYVNMLIETRGADFWNFFIPHYYISPWSFTRPIYENYISPYEATSYFGLIGIVAIFVLVFLRNKLVIPFKFFWVTIIAVFILIAIGNHLQVFQYRIPMPFSFLDNFIPFDRLRAPNRFFVFSYFGATVIFGYFLAYIRNYLQTQKTKIVFTSLIVLLLICERFIFPYPLMSIPVPEFYKQVGQMDEKFAIADIPLINPGFSLYNYYQIYHKKPIVDGEYFWTAYNGHTFDFIRSNQLLFNSAPCNLYPPNIDKQQTLKQLADANIRYVVVHNFILQSQNCPPLTIFIHKFFENNQIVFSDGEITVYSTIDKLEQ